jgi:hypothetical protein
MKKRKKKAINDNTKAVQRMLVEASNACVPASEPCLLLFEIFIEMLK